MNLLVGAVVALGRVFVDAGRVLANHWPQLVGLFLLGWAGRMGFLWLATVVSDVSPSLAVFIVPLAPMSTLVSLVLMLRATALSLPAFANLFAGLSVAERVREDFTVAGQVLLPFLAVYASAGLLRDDVRVFLYDTTADESLNTGLQQIDWGRADYAEGWALFALVVGALAARKVIALLALAEKHLAWAGVAAYIEVLWMMTLANAFASRIAEVTEWVTTRQAVAGVIGLYDAARAWLASVAGWADALLDAAGAFLGSLGSVVLVPVAWLAIGAAVYGQKLSGRAIEFETHEQVTARLMKVPNPVRRAVAQVAEPVTTPVKSTLGAIGKIAAAGVIPMVLFCIIFLVANQVQTLVALLLRHLIGPGEMLRQFALSPYYLLGSRLVHFVVILALLAAAVNAIVTGQQRSAPAADQAGVASSR